MLKKALQQGRRRETTESVPLGYVEDCFDPRTQLEAFFAIFLHVESKVDNIAFLDHVLFAFQFETSLLPYARLRAAGN